MTPAPARFPIVPVPTGGGLVAAKAFVPLLLEHNGVKIPVDAVLEPSAAASVLPHSIGLRLGAVWSRLTVAVTVPGMPDELQVIPLAVRVSVAAFPPERMAFAWASTDDVPVVLGQMSFFHQFDVCFHHAQAHVEVRPAERPVP